MSESQHVWTVMLIPLETTFGGRRLGTFESKDEAIACKREKEADPAYNPKTWDIRIHGPHDPSP